MMRRTTYLRCLQRFSLIPSSLLLVVALGPLHAQEASAPAPAAAAAPAESVDTKTQMELKYAEILSARGFPDYAEMVLKRIPGGGAMRKVIELRSLLAIGKFDRVQQLIAAEPNPDSVETWAMKTALADGYYSWGKYKEARGVYDEFFKKYPENPPEALNTFYRDGAYKYAQMLILMGDEKAALQAYNRVLKCKIERPVRRQMLGETMEIMLKLADNAPKAEQDAYLTQVDAIINELLWIQDLWFGKAIVAQAHVKMLRGDIDGAMKLIDDFREQLEGLDEILKQQEQEEGMEGVSKLSPMAECRYLIGKVLLDRAEKLKKEGGNKDEIKVLLVGKRDTDRKTDGALQHFYNVFIRYPNTPWAADAGSKAKYVKDMLERDFGAKIGISISPDQLGEVEKFQFQGARTLYNQQQFEPAAETYVKVLNLFPETPTAVAALGELARCYINLGTNLDFYADSVIGYLAERFGKREEHMKTAGDQLLKIALLYEEEFKDPVKKDRTYNTFFKYYPKHPRTPDLLYRFGEQAFQAKDYDKALTYFKQIKDNYPDQAISFDALSRVTLCFAIAEDLKGEREALEEYVKKLEGKDRPGQALIGAKFRLVTNYKKEADVKRREAKAAATNQPAAAAKAPEAAPPAPAPAVPAGEDAKAKYKEAALAYRKVVEEFNPVAKAYKDVIAKYKDAEQKKDEEGKKKFGEEMTALKTQYTEKKQVLDAAKLALDEAKKKAEGAAASTNAVPATAVSPVQAADPYEAIAARYDELMALLTGPDLTTKYQNTKEDIDKNKEVMEGCLFFKAICYSLMNKTGEDRKQALQTAVTTLQKLVQDSPKSRFSASALSQIGTLFILLDNPDEAQKSLRQLQEQYPETPEAKNSLYMLGSSLLELGKRERAVEIFKEMFKGEGQYSAGQILTAGNELLKAGENEIALEAFEKALAKVGKEPKLLEPALVGKGRALVGVGKYDEAIKTIDEMLKQFPKSGYAIDANAAKSRAYSELAMREQDATKRFDLFNDSVKAMKQCLLFTKEGPKRMELNLAVARILVQKAKSEEQFGNKDKAKDYLGQAVAAYQTMLMGNLDDVSVQSSLEQAFYESMPLVIQLEDWATAVEDGDRYLQTFKNGKYISEIRSMRTQARVRLTTSGGTAPAAGGGAGPAPAGAATNAPAPGVGGVQTQQTATAETPAQ
jgi:tetratricopeptide (TPR) repeat protein